MAIFHYTTLGQPVSDRDAKRFVISKQSLDRTQEVTVSTVNVISTAQLLIADGTIDPCDIRFKWNGTLVTHDRMGRITDLNPNAGCVDPDQLLIQRYTAAVRSRMLSEMDDAHIEAYREKYREWVRENLFEVVTTANPLPFKNEEDTNTATAKAEPSEIILAPEMAESLQIPKDTGTKVKCVEWQVAPNNSLMLVTSGGVVTVDELCRFAFHSDGGKLVVKPFDVARALVEIGLDGGAYARVRLR